MQGWLVCLGGPCSRQKMQKTSPFFGYSPRQNGHAIVTPLNVVQSFERRPGVPHGSRSMETFLNRRFSLLLLAKLQGLMPEIAGHREPEHRGPPRAGL